MDTAINFYDELDRARNGRPFRPYTIVLSGGERYTVDRQLSCAFSEELVIVAQPGVGLVRFPLRKVVAVETALAGGN